VVGRAVSEQVAIDQGARLEKISTRRFIVSDRTAWLTVSARPADCLAPTEHKVFQN